MTMIMNYDDGDDGDDDHGNNGDADDDDGARDDQVPVRAVQRLAPALANAVPSTKAAAAAAASTTLRR